MAQEGRLLASFAWNCADPAKGLPGVRTLPTPELLERAQELLGYRFKDPELLSGALTHASKADDRLASNERLEFLGDAVLGLVVCDDLFERFPNCLEGEMTKIKSVVVSRRVCAIISDQIGLTDLLQLGKGMPGGDELPNSLRADVFEAVIAAIYLDGGLEAARDFINPVVQEHVERSAKSEDKENYKSYLQQYVQKSMNATPRYEALDEKGPDHSKCFEVAVVIESRRFPSAWAPSKKQAEQRAAYLALRELDLIEADDSEYD